MTSNSLGRMGELLVCLDLLRRGFPAEISPTASSKYDILVDIKGVFTRIQVKATGRVRTHGNCKDAYVFNWGEKRYTKASIDLFAFVVVSTGEIIYLPVAGIRRDGFSISSHKFIAAGLNEKQLAEFLSRPAVRYLKCLE